LKKKNVLSFIKEYRYIYLRIQKSTLYKDLLLRHQRR